MLHGAVRVAFVAAATPVAVYIELGFKPAAWELHILEGPLQADPVRIYTGVDVSRVTVPTGASLAASNFAYLGGPVPFGLEIDDPVTLYEGGDVIVVDNYTTPTAIGIPALVAASTDHLIYRTDGDPVTISGANYETDLHRTTKPGLLIPAALQGATEACMITAYRANE